MQTHDGNSAMPLSIIWSMAVIAVQLFLLSITTVGKSWWGEMLPRGGLSVPWNPEINELYFSQHLDLSLRKKKKKSIRHSQMRQADVAGEPTWGASWICTSILGETEDTNGCFEFNICYFLPAGVTYGTFAVHSAVPSECFFFPSLHFFSSVLIWTFHEMKQKY